MKKKLSIYGAIIGDYYGSYWEFLSTKPKSVEDGLQLRPNGCHKFTDDTFMTLAVAKALCTVGFSGLADNVIKCMKEVAYNHWSSYGGAFASWLKTPKPVPYNSWGNGAAMRISPVGLRCGNAFLCREYSNIVTGVSHNHPDAMKLAGLVAHLVYKAYHNSDNETDHCKRKLWQAIRLDDEELYKQIASMSLEDLHANYQFTEKCADTVPQALYCFLSSDSFEDCLGRCMYIGGDSDTLAAIACSIAAPYYGDEQVAEFVEKLPELSKDLKTIVDVFTERYLC